jgi:hypothetical protein
MYIYFGGLNTARKCDMELFMETFAFYRRLVLYPLLAYSLVIEGLSVDDCNIERHKSRFYIMFAFFFMMLWGSSIIYFITRDNVLVVRYNSYALLPVTFIILVSIWARIITRCRKLHEDTKSISHLSP